jgi:hypothetical protein
MSSASSSIVTGAHSQRLCDEFLKGAREEDGRDGAKRHRV